MEAAGLKYVKLNDVFWNENTELIRNTVIPYQWEALNDRVPGAEPSYSVWNFIMAAQKDPDPAAFHGRVFQDSDLYKWIEAAAYSLQQHPDPQMEATVDSAVRLICDAQEEDGYLDTYYIVTGRDKEFTNIRENHELYCFGHLTEAAVAYFETTGKDELLKAAVRYADYIASRIGPEAGKKHAYPGHELAELALIRLYHATGQKRFLDQAVYYVNERGRQPYYFDGEGNPYKGIHQLKPYHYSYYQAHIPVREQDEALGHAVRAVYLYAGMAAVAKETGDKTLEEACERLFNSIVHEKMYITGGIGSTHVGEAFTHPFDLPNDTCYTESCASIGLVFFARRMLELQADARYAEVMERALYNGILSGMSLDGTKFFYVNPLEADPEDSIFDPGKYHVKTRRQGWFGCACCPPKIARLYASLPAYIYTESASEIFVNLFIGSVLEKDGFRLEQKVDWEPGLLRAEFTVSSIGKKTVVIRRPSWADDVRVFCTDGADEEEGLSGENRNECRDLPIKNGYLYLPSDKTAGTFFVEMRISPRFMQADARVKADAGKTALTYGPFVYCLEEADNGPDLATMSADPMSPFMFRCIEIGKRKTLQILSQGFLRTSGPQEELYVPYREAVKTPVTLRFIPYHMWANREEGRMRVFIPAEHA